MHRKHEYFEDENHIFGQTIEIRIINSLYRKLPQFWPKENRRTIETRVIWAYTRVGLYVAVYGISRTKRSQRLKSCQVYIQNIYMFYW